MPDKEDPGKSSTPGDILNQLAVIIKTSQLHDTSNIAVLSAIDKLITNLDDILSSGSVLTLELVGDIFYMNHARVKYSMEYILNFDFLHREFKRRGLGSLTINGLPAPKDIQVFVQAFIASGASAEPLKALSALSEGLAGSVLISVGPVKKIKEEEAADVRRQVKKTYFNAVSYTKGVMNKIKAGEKITIRKAKRIVESMVELLLGQEELLLGMTAIKEYDDYTFNHSVNVSILSIALGQKLGLSKKALTELGLVALFHDIGKIEVPLEILNKPTSFSEDEWKVMRRHPFWSVCTLLKLKGLDNISIKTAISAFEHHLNYDTSGYPKISRPLAQDFFSKIITITDQYDGMTSSRVYSRIPMPPDKALRVMMERSGTQLDPLLFKIFINMVGVLPIGTLVVLDTKELGLVYSGNAAQPDRPGVVIITDSNGNKVDGHIADLTEKDSSGRYTRSIVKTMDPNKYKINLAEYLL